MSKMTLEQQLVFAKLSGNEVKADSLRNTIMVHNLVENSAVLQSLEKKRFIAQSKRKVDE